MTFGASGCSDRGDLGRHSPSLVSKVYTGTLAKAKDYLGEDVDADLPLTAAEDALRSRSQDMQSIRYSGVISQIVRAPGGDGFSRVAAMTQDLRVDRQRFASFVEAAGKVMQIDNARRTRLKGLDALTARRQSSMVAERREINDKLIRNSVRAMRERSDNYRQNLQLLPVELPNVPLTELQTAHDDFHEDVVRFHAKIDQRAHGQLGRNAKVSLK